MILFTKNRPFTIFGKNKMAIFSSLYYVKDPRLVGKLVSVNGAIVHISKGKFILQDYTSLEDRTHLIALECRTDDIACLEIGSYARVTGILNSETIVDYYIQCTEIKFITKEEADDAMNEIKLGFFDQDYIKQYEKNTAQELRDFLQVHAYLAGFKLVAKHSLNQPSVKLRCYLHGKNGKNPDLNTDCPFFVNITRFKDEGIDKWHVTKVFNSHNHNLNPEIFAHKNLPKEQIDFIQMLSAQFIPPIKIAALFRSKFKYDLSREQISYVATADSERSKAKITETVDLEDYMKTINGVSYIYPPENNSPVKIRQGIATFTKEELSSLTNYGDFISIDPTFASLTTHWVIIPITTIGSEREIRSGGLIFTSNIKSETFRWIIDLFINVLPTKDILRTMISDEDSGLDGAFTLIKNEDDIEEFKEKVSHLNRIICSWHKTQNFLKQLTSLKLDKKERERLLSIFKIMIKSRDEAVCDECYSELCKNENIKEYLDKCVKPILCNVSKSKFTGFCGGYQSSSISEASNSRLKKLLPTRQVTLKEVRQMLITAEEMTMISKRFIKGRKQHKMRNPQVLDIMKNFHVSQVIAEAISGSITKANDSEKLSIKYDAGKDQAVVTDTIKDNEISYAEHFTVTESGCTCKKQIQVGIPCSHFIKFLIEKKKNIYDFIKINERWIDHFKNTPSLLQSRLSITTKKILQTPPCDEKDRYVLLKSKCLNLIAKAAQTQSSYELVDSMLDEIETKMNGKNMYIFDDTASRPGRPKKNKKFS